MGGMSSASKAAREKRKFRIRKKISGTSERPRLVVYRSNKHFFLQAIDDLAGKTVVSASTLEKGLKEKLKGNNITVAGQVAVVLSERAKEKGINAMVFDRNGYAYHGRIKKIAESMRENGIQI